MQTEKFICDWKSKLYDAYAWQEVNKIPKCSLLHDIINPPKRAKILNGPYSPILHGCMNNIKGKEKFKKFRIILDNGSSSAIVMGRLVGKIHPEKYAVTQWHTQAVNITTNIKVEVYFALPILITTNVGTCKFHVDGSFKDVYDIILGKYLWTELGLHLKLSEHVIEADNVTFQGSTTPMFGLVTNAFKYLNRGEITPEE